MMTQTLPIKSRRRTAKEAMERTPDLAELEMAWEKRLKKPGKLFPADLYRGPKSVTSSEPNYQVRSTMHTHPVDNVSFRGRSFPSPGDIREFLLSNLTHPNLRSDHIISTNSKGQVIGYLSYRLTNRWMQIPKNERQSLIWRFFAYSKTGSFLGRREATTGKKELFQTTNRSSMIFLRFLVRKGVLQLRLTPMPNYRVDHQQGVFVRNT